MTECAEKLDSVWDTRGGFVCGMEKGHDGRHKSRPSKSRPVIEWYAKGEA